MKTFLIQSLVIFIVMIISVLPVILISQALNSVETPVYLVIYLVAVPFLTMYVVAWDNSESF